MKRLLICTTLALLSACGGGGSDSPSTPPVTQPSALSYASPQVLTVGVALTPLNPTVTGTVASYSAAPSLPAGLSLNATTGVISGTPTSAVAANNYTITAQNSAGSTTFVLAITVNIAVQSAIEPGSAQTIATGQSLPLFFVQRGGGAAYPRYIDPTLVTWSSSNSARVTVSAAGVITGVSEGNATITAQYQSNNLTLAIKVSGAFVTRNLAVAGQGVRRYVVYQPPAATAVGTRPAIIAMHGGGGSAQNIAATGLLVTLAEQRGIVLALPEGTGLIQTFNAGACCGTAQTQNIDDVAFISAVLDDVLVREPVDAARVYATGFSNGGMMSHRLACAMSNRIAGIAAVGGASGQFDQARTQFYGCNPARPIPVLHIHATNDRNYPYAGGAGDDTASGVAFYPVDATITDWIARNNVTSVAVVDNVTPTTSCRRYATAADPNRASAPVVLCRVDPPDLFDASTGIVHGGGHSWPGGLRAPTSSSDSPLVDFNATAYLWSFWNP